MSDKLPRYFYQNETRCIFQYVGEDEPQDTLLCVLYDRLVSSEEEIGFVYSTDEAEKIVKVLNAAETGNGPR